MGCDRLRNSARGQLVLKEFREGTQSCDQGLQDRRLRQVDLAGFCDFSFGKVCRIFNEMCPLPRDTLLSFDMAMKRVKGPQIPAIFSIFPRRHFFAVFREIKEAVFEVLRDKARIKGDLILAYHRIGAVLKEAPFENETPRLCARRINGIEAHRFVIRAPDPVARFPRQFAQLPPQRFAVREQAKRPCATP